jgi:hypothetical protein
MSAGLLTALANGKKKAVRSILYATHALMKREGSMKVSEYWKMRGVNYGAVNEIIDTLPEGHPVGEAAKLLVCMLDTYSFEEEEDGEN